MDRLTQLAQQYKIDQDASITDSQSMLINAPIDLVWSVLTDINDWTQWHEKISKANCAKVAVGKEFSWVHRGTKIKSQIAVMDKHKAFGWTGRVLWIKAIHLFLLEEVGENQTSVTTSESMDGLLLFIFYSHQRLNHNLIDWLKYLKLRTEHKQKVFIPTV